jgi:nucleoside-triphosphatase THEP1
MRKTAVLSEVWLKASVLGSTWAASEIILGSFLHNLRVPFKGSVLTAIALILLITVSSRWKDRGLFWRSGLICSIMKTMSPSAVIFGPMVAILMEALLLDLSVRLVGRNYAGIMIGSVLAMTWIFFQKILNFLLFYGMNIVDIYTNLVDYAAKQLNLHFQVFWLPLLLVMLIYSTIGVIAGITGIIAAHRLDKYSGTELQSGNNVFGGRKPNQEEFKYSLVWLSLSFVALVGSFILINRAPLGIWTASSLLLITVWVLRYRQAMRKLARPRFWITFIILTALSAFLISYVNDRSTWMDGIIIGLQMNFRAAIVVIGFTALGKELYNPAIRTFLSGSVFRPLQASLELAFESLPDMIANLPNPSDFLRSPSRVVAVLVNNAEERFAILKEERRTKVYIVSGDIGSGKTRFMHELSEKLRAKGIAVAGFYSPRIPENEETVGYDLVFLPGGERREFLRIRGEAKMKIGRYSINAETLEYGKMNLHAEKISGKQAVFIDEAGKLELEGGGWMGSILTLLEIPGLILVMAVRKEFCERIIEKCGIENADISDTTQSSLDKTLVMILANTVLS